MSNILPDTIQMSKCQNVQMWRCQNEGSDLLISLQICQDTLKSGQINQFNICMIMSKCKGLHSKASTWLRRQLDRVKIYEASDTNPINSTHVCMWRPGLKYMKPVIPIQSTLPMYVCPQRLRTRLNQAQHAAVSAQWCLYWFDKYLRFRYGLGQVAFLLDKWHIHEV